jgi:hypothetical protein
VLRTILRIQAVYYIVTGLWPLASMATFEAVTGPKIDEWLVKMVGLLAATIGACLWTGSREARPPAAIIQLALTAALSFTAIDVWYVLVGRIRSIYLGDAVVEIALMLLIGALARARPRA